MPTLLVEWIVNRKGNHLRATLCHLYAGTAVEILGRVKYCDLTVGSHQRERDFFPDKPQGQTHDLGHDSACRPAQLVEEFLGVEVETEELVQSLARLR